MCLCGLTHVCMVWLWGVCVLQALLQGPFHDQLQQRLSGLPGEVVQQLVHMISQLADSIGQHGQQVRRGGGGDLWIQTAPLAQDILLIYKRGSSFFLQRLWWIVIVIVILSCSSLKLQYVSITTVHRSCAGGLFWLGLFCSEQLWDGIPISFPQADCKRLICEYHKQCDTAKANPMSHSYLRGMLGPHQQST